LERISTLDLNYFDWLTDEGIYESALSDIIESD